MLSQRWRMEFFLSRHILFLMCLIRRLTAQGFFRIFLMQPLTLLLLSVGFRCLLPNHDNPYDCVGF